MRPSSSRRVLRREFPILHPETRFTSLNATTSIQMRRTPPTFLAVIIMVSHRILRVAATSAVVFSLSGHAEPVVPDAFGPSVFTAPGAFPTSLYSHYYNSPTATSVQPQPVISDPVSVSDLSLYDGESTHS